MKNQSLIISLFALSLLSACGDDGSSTTSIDTDQDGIYDAEDACPQNPKITTESEKSASLCGCDLREDGTCPTTDQDPEPCEKSVCGCGVPSTDSDGDGMPDCKDKCPNDPKKRSEGICGCGNDDADSDGDGMPDCKDKCPADPKKTSEGICGCGNDDADSDGDGMPDCKDKCPADPKKTAEGICGCNIDDADSDGDGMPDCKDQCPNDPNKTAEGICGCGNVDNTRDFDQNGVLDCLESCDNSSVGKTEPGVCGCDTEDVDSDGDGVMDCLDLCPTDPKKIVKGECGCNTSDGDLDLDGTPDCKDLCPQDPKKTAKGVCGCGIDDADSDHDGIPDCQDQCPSDPNKIVEGLCGCGIVDYNVDTDGDGTLDCKDQCPVNSHKSVIDFCGCEFKTSDNNGLPICVGTDGLIQADYSLAHRFSRVTSNTSASLTLARQNRQVATPVIHIAYSPAGNLIPDPGLTQDTFGWSFNNLNLNDALIFYNQDELIAENSGTSRPFGDYPILKTQYSKSSFDWTISIPDLKTLPGNPSTVPLTIAVFAKTLYNKNTKDDISLYVNDQHGNYSSLDHNEFSLFAFTSEVNTSNVKVSYQGIEQGYWAGYFGPLLHYFQAYLGEREVRFSNDGTHWTAWEAFTPDTKNSSKGNSDKATLPWQKNDWDITDPKYGGNSEYGTKTIYMQTHDKLTDKYYEATDTFEYVKPEEGGHIFIGEVDFAGKLSSTKKEEIQNYCASRSITEGTANIYFIPGGNLLSPNAFEASSDSAKSVDGWNLSGNAAVKWNTSTDSNRRFADMPYISLPNGASIRQTVDLSQYGTKLQSKPHSALMFVAANGVKTTLEVKTDTGSGCAAISTSNTSSSYSLYNNPSGDGSKIIQCNTSASAKSLTYTITASSDDNTKDAHIQIPWLSFGMTYYRLSFDQKQSWTPWYDFNNQQETNYDTSAIRASLMTQMIYPNAPVVKGNDGLFHVTLQTYNTALDQYYETNASVKVN